MAKDVKKAAASIQSGRTKAGKAPAPVSAGFKKKFNAEERADIGVKRQQMRERLYAVG